MCDIDILAMMKSILNAERKIDVLCHAIVITVRPSLTSPLLLSIGIFLYKKCGSRELSELLSSQGFCSSYSWYGYLNLQ